MGSARFDMGFLSPRFHTVIPVSKRWSLIFHSPYGNGECPFPYRDSLIPVSIRWSPFQNGDQWFFTPRMGTGSARSHTGILWSPFAGNFWFLGQNFRPRAGASVTQGKAKTPIPVTIRGAPEWENTARQKNSHTGSARFGNELLTIWGLTDTSEDSTGTYGINGWH